jgi:hypothetical protein
MSENPIVDWLTDPNACFLLGAGCSVCAGKPLIEELSLRVISKLDARVKALFDNLEGSPGRKATVEDLLNQLFQLKRVLSSRKIKTEGDWDLDLIEQSIEAILAGVVKEIDGTWNSSPTHERFFRRLASHTSRKLCDIFTLNYDIVIEASLEVLQIPYLDGFRGAENAYFDQTFYEDDLKRSPFFRLYKLHGSINWIRDEDASVRRHPYDRDASGARHVIYPSEQKYFQSQYGVYESLLSRFRARLREERPNNKLIVLGYSLLDDHITEAIIDAVCVQGSNLTIYAFVGPQDDVISQTARLQALADRCHNRFNVMVGEVSFIGPALEKKEWEELKSKSLWKFENLVAMLAGK